MADEFISEDDVQVSPRGRTVQLDADLVKLLKKLTPGKAVRLTDSIGPVDATKRPTVSGTIRKNFKGAHGPDAVCRIDYTPEGIPQVRFKATEAAE